MTNPVTDLPEGPIIDDKLNELTVSDNHWAALLVSMSGLGDFRELYGFVAADDVLRAVTLMVRNAVREHGSNEDFIGHLGPEDFLIITAADKVALIRERIESRVRQSREYFYPLKDRERAREAADANHLQLRSGVVDHKSGLFKDPEALRSALMAAAAPGIV
jgi:GGDEF domain-containing protein